jgi:glycosyltransferase involved in cell wall biosynthesis
MSNAVLEAMAAGRAVVATAVGGNPEVVDDGTTGSLVPPGDPPALAQAVIDLLQDTEKSRRFGACGSNRVDREFTVQRMAEATATFYDGLIVATELAPASGETVR